MSVSGAFYLAAMEAQSVHFVGWAPASEHVAGEAGGVPRWNWTASNKGKLRYNKHKYDEARELLEAGNVSHMFGVAVSHSSSCDVRCV